VRLSAAAWGAFVGTVLLQLARPIFRIYVTKLIMGSSRFKIYGSLGAIPLLMLWLWLLWLIVLFGAEVAFTFQNVGLLRFRDKLSRFSRLYIDGFLAARIVMYVGRHFWRDGEPAPVEDLAETLNISPEEAKDAARRLVDLDLLTPVGEELELYHPARDLSKLKVIDVLTASDRLRHQSRSGKEEDRPYEDRLEAVFHSVIGSRRTAVRDMTFRDLLESCEVSSPPPPAQQPPEPEQNADENHPSGAGP
jgi:membrane protein